MKNLKDICGSDLPWKCLDNKTILIIGATGMIGSCLVDCIMFYNDNYHANIKVIAVSRNLEKAKERFNEYWTNKNFSFISHDVKKPFSNIIQASQIDFAIHAASNTHPVAYSTDPIGTITTNVLGTLNLLELLKNNKNCKVLFVSSVEIYGENNTDKLFFKENDLGYIDCNTMRAGYPESKRVSESLCQAYISQYQMEIVVARLCRVFGPTILDNDSKALSQFIQRAVNKENIILKSDGKQYYSYIYVFDAVTALLTLLLKGLIGNVYNIASRECNITLKELAEIIANAVNKKVIYDIPDLKEAKGYSTATKAILNADKIKKLGWKPNIDIETGIKETIEIISASIQYD